MKLKEIIRSIGNRNLDLQERQFRLLVSIGLCGLAAGIVNSILIGDDIRGVGILAAAFVLFVAVFLFSLRFHKIQLGAVIIAVVIIFLLLPLSFLTAGGIYGGAPVWFLFGLVYVCLVVKGKAKYILFACGFTVDAACYCVAYAYPAFFFQHTLETAYIDSFVSLMIVAALICGMIIFQNAIYRSENAIAKKQRQEIEELNRAQSRFFSSMSHEIRTPVNTIIGLNELILRETVSDEVAEDAGKIRDASKMLLALINDFLDMSKIQSGKMDILPAPYDVGAMLSDIVNMTWVRAREKEIEFRVDVDQAVPAQLVGDEVRIQQILLNVLNNAVKYTQAGSVSLSVESKGCQDGYAQMTYTVTDTGIGIKKENLPHLFSAFRRVDEEKNRHIEGTGLGLAIVKQLLELMGGGIAVNSVYTKGSTFVITLPQKIVGEAKIGEFHPAGRRRPTGEGYRQSFEAPNAHVLIVDDNDANLLVAKKLLQGTGIQTDTAVSGGKCLEKTLQNRYDLILMDHLMPEMDGIECLRAVRAQTGGLNHGTPVVILTANAGEEYRALYRKEGFDGYLLKPVSGIQLEAEVLRHLPGELVSTAGEAPAGVSGETPVLAHNRRMPVLISTDSVCDLPEEIIGKYPIAVMPYLVHTEDGEFLDGVEAETDGVLSYMGKRGGRAQALPPAVESYEEFFAENLTKAQYIVHIAMAKNVSAGYGNALEASKAFGNVIVIDSGHLSSGMGFLVLQAAKWAQSGLSAGEIAREITGLKSRVRTSFLVGSIEYLARSGRLSPMLSAACRALMLHPVIILKNGGLKLGSVRMGTREYARGRYIASALKGRKAIDTETLFITYAGLTREELASLEEQVKKKADFQEIIFQRASPAISINCGPGTFGLLFMMKR